MNGFPPQAGCVDQVVARSSRAKPEPSTIIGLSYPGLQKSASHTPAAACRTGRIHQRFR